MINPDVMADKLFRTQVWFGRLSSPRPRPRGQEQRLTEVPRSAAQELDADTLEGVLGLGVHPMAAVGEHM